MDWLYPLADGLNPQADWLNPPAVKASPSPDPASPLVDKANPFGPFIFTDPAPSFLNLFISSCVSRPKTRE